MSKKLLVLGMFLGLAACAGDNDAEMEEGAETEEVVPATPAPAPMDTMMMDTMMSDTMMGPDTMMADTMSAESM